MGLTERQKVIVDIAAQMIAQNGYRETSMRDIAARLGVKAASIYSHFESKDHLLQVILGVFSDELEKVMQEVSAVEPVEKKFYTLIELYITAVLKSVNGFAIYQRYSSIADESNGFKYSSLDQKFFLFVEQLYAEMFPQFEEKPYYLKNSTVLILIGVLNNVHRYVNRNMLDINIIATDVYQRWLYGFKKDMNPHFVANYRPEQ